MPSATNSLGSFIDRELPGLRLNAVTARPPQWPALRFELAPGIPEAEQSRRIAQATDTAVAIFEAVFAPEDDGFLSFTSWLPWADDEYPRLLALLPQGCRPARSEGRDYWDDGGDDEYVTYSLAVRPRSVGYRSLFRLIAANELGEGQMGGYVHFINASVPMVFLMYDDRGAMLLAAKEEDIRDVRTRFGDWIIP